MLHQLSHRGIGGGVDADANQVLAKFHRLASIEMIVDHLHRVGAARQQRESIREPVLVDNNNDH